MASRTVGVADTAPGTAVAEVDTVERASPDIRTTTTADPGSGGVTLAITSAAKFPSTNNYKIRVEDEIMLVTGGAGTTSWTVTRGYDNTTAVAHTIGVTVAQIVAVQRVSPIDERMISYLGRAATFRTPGRAGSAGQKIFALHNATGSPVLVDVEKLIVEKTETVIVAVTVLPPVIRLQRFTAVPTNGTAGSKVPEDTALGSNAALTVWQDASADGTLSGTALTVTLPASNVMQEHFARRMITAVGDFPQVPQVFLADEGDRITLRPLEGICVFLDYIAAGQNAATDMWAVNARWTEYTIA